MGTPAPRADAPVRGVEADAETRCAHYAGPNDRVAIRFRCCGDYFCCHACHEALTEHEPARWPPAEFDRTAVLCGACRAELTIREYMGRDRCPRCDAGFNPRCAAHYPLYFDIEPPGISSSP